jgi:hypothetical protein
MRLGSGRPAKHRPSEVTCTSGSTYWGNNSSVEYADHAKEPQPGAVECRKEVDADSMSFVASQKRVEDGM